MSKQQGTPPAKEWDGIVRREYDIEIKSVDNELRSIDVVASTETLDSHNDIVEQDFNLRRYKKNPVVLWHHNSFGYFDGTRAEDFLPIGKAEDVKVEDGKLTARLLFVKGDGPDSLSEKIWRRVQQGVLKGVSIGFKPGEVLEEKVGDKRRFRLRKNDLYEISMVPIPSNPDTVGKSLEFEREHLGRMAAKQSATSGKAKANMDLEQALAALEKIKGELAVSNSKAAEIGTKAAKLETDLAAEKTISSKLQSDLDKANKALGEQSVELSKTKLDALQGVKFAPAEREDLDGMVKDIGLDRVVKYLEKRPALSLTEGVTVEGKAIGEDRTPAPSISADPGADLAAEATKGL